MCHSADIYTKNMEWHWKPFSEEILSVIKGTFWVPVWVYNCHLLGWTLEFLIVRAQSFTLHFFADSTENVVLHVIPTDPLVGDNMTLNCVADGNPAPTSFNFHLKVLASQKRQQTFRIHLSLHAEGSLNWAFPMSPQGEVVKVENANTYTITNVTRETSGEYKCSLVDNPTMEASKEVVVKCKSICLFATSPCCKHCDVGVVFG